MSTWWRQARRDGKTITDRLERIVALVEESIEPGEGKWNDNAEWGLDMALKLQHEMHGVKRIRSILRRLKRCVQCHGTGKVPELEERGGPWMEYNVLVWEECPACGGTGRVKEER